MSTFSIKNWSGQDQPREKMLKAGPSALSDAELIAILLRNGSVELNALDLAKQILADTQNDLNLLARSGVKGLSKHKGMGDVKALTLIAAIELGRRCRHAEARKLKRISSSKDAFELFAPLLSHLLHEEFWILLLNRANGIVDLKSVSRGGVSGTVADPKIIFSEALALKASGLILAHNHPSTNPKPSESDIQLTRKLKEGGRLLEIAVLDHIIIAGTSFYSFADEGTL